MRQPVHREPRSGRTDDGRHVHTCRTGSRLQLFFLLFVCCVCCVRYLRVCNFGEFTVQTHDTLPMFRALCGVSYLPYRRHPPHSTFTYFVFTMTSRCDSGCDGNTLVAGWQWNGDHQYRAHAVSVLHITFDYYRFFLLKKMRA